MMYLAGTLLFPKCPDVIGGIRFAATWVKGSRPAVQGLGFRIGIVDPKGFSRDSDLSFRA